MNFNLKEILNNIYIALFNNAEASELFEAFNFQPYKTGYRSTTDISIDGSKGSNTGHVCLYENSSFGLQDFRVGFMSLWDYCGQKYGLTDNRDIYKKLAQLSGVKLPKRKMSAEDIRRYKAELKKAKIWEDAHLYFNRELYGDLTEEGYKGNTSAQAKEVRDYLTTRGYNVYSDTFKNELGFIPSQQELFKHLEKLGHSKEDINNCIKLGELIGNYGYKLTIANRSEGRVRGIIVRDIYHNKDSKTPKYMKNEGSLKTTLFGLSMRGGEEIILTEGALDCLAAKDKGFNCAAFEGTSLKDEQLKQLERSKVKIVNLILDNDDAGNKAIKTLLPQLLQSFEFKTYIVPPESLALHKDIDEYLRKEGAEAFKNVLSSKTKSAHRFLAVTIQNELISSVNKEGTLTDKAKERFKDSIIQAEQHITSPSQINEFRDLNEKLITKNNLDIDLKGEDIDFKREELRDIKAKKRQQAELKKLIENVSYANIGEELSSLGKGVNDIQAIQNESQFRALLEPYTFDQWSEDILNTPEGLNTEYVLTDNQHKKRDLILPSGALTVIGAPTGHGKTTAKINFMLNCANLYPELKFHFFSYEEHKKAILMKVLNCHLNRDISYNNEKGLREFLNGNTDNIAEDELPNLAPDIRQFFEVYIITGRLNIHYVDYTSEELISNINKLRDKGDIGGVFIDYAQLLYSSQSGTLSRPEQLKHICTDLKNCAVNTQLPLILGSQFNREVFNPLKMHPTKLSDASEIEKIAALIIGLWNYEKKMYLTEAEAKELKDNKLPQKAELNRVYVTILKERGGSGGEALLKYTGNRRKIDNITEDIKAEMKEVFSNDLLS